METETNPQKKFSINFYHLFLGVIMFLVVRSCLEGAALQRIPYSEFKHYLEQGDVKHVTIRGETMTGEFKSPVNGKTTFNTTVVPDEISKELEKHDVTYDSLGSGGGISNFILFLLPTLIFIGFWYYILRRGLKGMSGGGGSFMSVGKSKAKIYVEKDTKTTFKDVAGADEDRKSVV